MAPAREWKLLINNKNMRQPTIGLEIHIELKTKTKMFCSCKNDAEERQPNVNICPICMGHPGTLPVANEEALRKAIKTGLALNCRIPEYSKFDRKNYFYPDLPKGYQISQYDRPLCQEGFLEVGGKKIRITRVHLEEDTGRLLHESDASLVDFNRAGIPLMELVTEPDITSAEQAREFAQDLHLILHYLDVSDADMDKGQMRVEVNISLGQKGKLGTKVEIKNLNSFRSVEKSINYEIERQKEVLDGGGQVIQETRGWDEAKGKTVSQREKEKAHDYRYFPEPDLPILHLGIPEYLNRIRAEIPELPQTKEKRLKREYNIDENSINFFVYNKDLGEYFEKVVSEFGHRLSPEKLARLTRLAVNYITTDLRKLLKEAAIIGENFLITPENFAEFVTMIEEGKISSTIAKMILEEMFKTGADPSHIIEEKGWVRIDDRAEIEKIIKEIILKNPKAVEDFKKGKENAFQFLIGQVMAQSKGKANPEMVKEILRKSLTG